MKFDAVSKTRVFPRNEGKRKDRTVARNLTNAEFHGENLNRLLNSTRLDTSLPFTARVEDERVAGRGREEIG